MLMPDSIIWAVECCAKKDGYFKGLEFLNQNKEEFEFLNKDYDKQLVEHKQEAPYSAIPAEFPGVEIEATVGSDEMVVTSDIPNGTDNGPEAALAAVRNAGLDDPRNAP